jgi:hypothetical protein
MNARLVPGVFLALCAGTATAERKPPALTPENRIAIVRSLSYEWATTRKPLPAGKLGVEVTAKGEVNEGKLRQQLTNHGAAIQTGSLVQITGVEFRGDQILFEINGGGRGKKRKWYERVQISVAGSGGTVPVSGPTGAEPRPDGSNIVLRFSGYVPDLTPDQVRARLTVLLDFSRRTAAVPWIDTLPEEFQQAIREKRAVVGMDREMVLAALGRPDRKVRETRNGVEEEDWLYGQPPLVTFVTFVGNQVVRVQEFK